MAPSGSGHLPINGLQLYDEAHGELGASEAVPLLLIPGAFLSTDSMKQWVAAFIATRPVIGFDQQGHGRTADAPRTMSYEQFGDAAAALLHVLEVERADVLGYSRGGAVALQLALRHPELVSKLVTLSATYRHDGWYPAVPKALEGLSGDLFGTRQSGSSPNTPWPCPSCGVVATRRRRRRERYPRSPRPDSSSSLRPLTSRSRQSRRSSSR